MKQQIYKIADHYRIEQYWCLFNESPRLLLMVNRLLHIRPSATIVYISSAVINGMIITVDNTICLCE